ncbi:hypothetical protein LR48_Vigan511s002800 [Vigna angularis]|uniref:Uncharacterized protein n=1 Tax=Phaseolus angularis TaxID=3914 RepID=A0A0L9TC56_PHAAN|nr:hypothetical protein LR48_Vigan511s002800 [Vigna angularis]
MNSYGGSSEACDDIVAQETNCKRLGYVFLQVRDAIKVNEDGGGQGFTMETNMEVGVVLAMRQLAIKARFWFDGI